MNELTFLTKKVCFSQIVEKLLVVFRKYLISGITNLVKKLPYELPNHTGFRILLCQNLVEIHHRTQSSFQKLNFDNSCQKARQIRWQIFEVLLGFTGFLYFLLNIFPRILRTKIFSALTWPSLLQTWSFGIFL